jgi:hypothetical protein
MKKWLSQWLISLMAMGLYAMPAVAIDGTVNGIELGPVTCLNYITDQAAVGRVTAGIYDCSELAATNGGCDWRRSQWYRDRWVGAARLHNANAHTGTRAQR